MPAAIRRYGIHEGSRSRSKVEQRFSRLYIIYRGGFLVLLTQLLRFGLISTQSEACRQSFKKKEI